MSDNCALNEKEDDIGDGRADADLEHEDWEEDDYRRIKLARGKTC